MLDKEFVLNAVKELSRRDNKLAIIASQVRSVRVPHRKANFESLVSIIVKQQLSGTAARTIFSRFKELFPDSNISPMEIASIEATRIRNCGVSNAKIGYIKELSSHFVENPRFISNLKRLDDGDAIKALTGLKGIGTWSADIFLLFYLKRTDVFPRGDATLIKAIKRLYGIEGSPERHSQIECAAEAWSPYRSVAALMLWEWSDLPSKHNASEA